MQPHGEHIEVRTEKKMVRHQATVPTIT